MSIAWNYFWPAICAGLVIGALTGWLAYRQLRIGPADRLAGTSAVIQDLRRRRKLTFIGGTAATLIAAALWHGPLGAGDRLAADVETNARAELDRLEMTAVTAELERDPLRRRLVLTGPADDFQRQELVRILDAQPGVAGVRWRARVR